MAKSVLICGASGFIGKNLINELISLDYEVVSISRSEIPAVTPVLG